MPERTAATMKPLPNPTPARRAQSQATLAAMKPRMEKAAVLSRPWRCKASRSLRRLQM